MKTLILFFIFYTHFCRADDPCQSVFKDSTKEQLQTQKHIVNLGHKSINSISLDLQESVIKEIKLIQNQLRHSLIMPSGITIEIIPEANGRYYFNKCRIETGVCKPATQYHQLPHNPDQYGKALISHEYGHAILEANTNFENIPEVKISEEAVILFDKRKEYDEMEASLFESAPNEIAIGKIELDAQSKYGRIHASAMIIAPLEVVKGYHELFADMVAATHLQSQGENPAKAIAFEGFENLGKKPKSNRPYQSDEHYTFTLAKHLLWKNHFSKAKKPAQFSALLKILAKAIAKTTSTQVRDSKMMYEFLNGTTNASTTHDKMSSELVENFNILLKQDI